jgi:hypothetical protein
VTDICPENLKLPIGNNPIPAAALQSYMALTGRTAGAPDAQLPITLFLFGSLYFRQYFFGKGLQLECLTKKIGFIGREHIHYVGKLLLPSLVIFQKMVVFAEACHVMLGQPLAKPFLQQIFCVMVEKKSAMTMNKIPYEPELLFGHRNCRIGT